MTEKAGQESRGQRIREVSAHAAKQTASVVAKGGVVIGKTIAKTAKFALDQASAYSADIKGWKIELNSKSDDELVKIWMSNCASAKRTAAHAILKDRNFNFEALKSGGSV